MGQGHPDGVQFNTAGLNMVPKPSSLKQSERLEDSEQREPRLFLKVTHFILRAEAPIPDFERQIDHFYCFCSPTSFLLLLLLHLVSDLKSLPRAMSRSTSYALP